VVIPAQSKDGSGPLNPVKNALEICFIGRAGIGEPQPSGINVKCPFFFADKRTLWSNGRY
jgi:hypothetical protein